jgi:hypothetical protein
MNVTTATSAIDSRGTTAAPSRRSLLRAGALGGFAAAAATELVAAVARVSDVSMRAGGIGAESSEPIPVLGFAVATLLWTAVGTGIALAMARWAKHPARTFTITAIVLTIVSFAGPVLAGHTTMGTKIILELTHVVAALIVIPVLRFELAKWRGR